MYMNCTAIYVNLIIMLPYTVIIDKSTRIFATLFLAHFSDNTPLCRFKPVFLKNQEPGLRLKNDLSNSAKQVVHPVHKCPIVAIWYDKISCCFRDQSTLEPFKVGRNGWALSNKPSVDLVNQTACGSYLEPSRRRS